VSLGGESKTLVKNFDFEKGGDKPSKAAGFVFNGDSSRGFVGANFEFSSIRSIWGWWTPLTSYTVAAGTLIR
jgi:hypothetical protein